MANDVERRRSKARFTVITVSVSLLFLSILPTAQSLHHMQRRAPRRLLPQQDNTPLIITNQCPEDIYPGINTQSGNGPQENGFKLSTGESRNLTVSENWQGRVWGRTNCSFNADGTKPANGSPGRACGSGDCNGVLKCVVGGDTPVTLAEFTLDAGDGQTYYDISLVDGYNIPMAIQVEPFGNSSLDEIPPNLTNPTCTATVTLLAPQGWNPYANNEMFLGTNSSYALPLDSKVTDETCANWCPWNLQVNQPMPPDDGVYTYPDNSVQRPIFNPCYSACTKWNLPEDCCTGEHNSPSTCQPSEYSKSAKTVCPDAYSYAFDDQTSTFIIPSGAGFNVIFCPGGRSSNILSAESGNVSDASGGQVSFGGGGNGNNADNMVARDCNDMPTDRHNSKCEQNSSASGTGYETGSMQNMGLIKRAEYDWTGIERISEALSGIKVLDLKRRGLHLNRISQVLEKRSDSATTTIAAGEVRSVTCYLMCAGLFVTAVLFSLL